MNKLTQFRLTPVNLSTTQLSKQARRQHQVMPFLGKALPYARDTSLFERMVLVTFKRENGMLFLLIFRVQNLNTFHSYCNMDFIILSALVGIALHRVACQWSKNLDKCMADFPEEMRIKETTIETAIPSWHINGHGQTCRQNYNLLYMKGAAKTRSLLSPTDFT